MSRSSIGKTKNNIDQLTGLIQNITSALAKTESTQKEVVKQLTTEIATLRDQLVRALKIGPEMLSWQALQEIWDMKDPQQIKNAAIFALAALLMGPMLQARQREMRKLSV